MWTPPEVLECFISQAHEKNRQGQTTTHQGHESGSPKDLLMVALHSNREGGSVKDLLKARPIRV